MVQVPADGKPIVLFSDHGSIGGYPKIAVVITADHDRAAQLLPGSKINVSEISNHANTNIYIVEKFLPVGFRNEGSYISTEKN